MVVGANQNVARAFLPYPSTAVFTPSAVSVGNVITWSGGSTSTVIQYSNLNSNVQSFRTPAWGVRLSCLSSITNASGLVYIAVVPWEPHLAVNSNFPASEDEFTSCIWHTIVPVSELTTRPMIVPGRLLDDSVHRYRATNSAPAVVGPTTDIETTTGHVAICVLVTGSTVGNAILAEYVAHYECIPRPTLGQFDALPSPFVPAAMEEQRTVDIGMPTAYIESTFSRVLNAAVGWAGQMLGSAASQAITAYRSGAMRRHYGIDRAPPTNYMAYAEPPRIEWKEDYIMM